MTAYTKTTIIEKISEEINQSSSDAKDTVEKLLEIMKSTLSPLGTTFLNLDKLNEFS